MEPFDRGREHLHQLAPLFGHVAFEHLLEARVDLEQAVIEQRCGIVGDGRDERERVLDERDLGFGQHGISSGRLIAC